MRLENNTLNFVVNFLLGVAWATVLLGAIGSFLFLFHVTFLGAVLFPIIGTIPGMIAVLSLEHFITSQEKLTELKKQTKLLNSLLQK